MTTNPRHPAVVWDMGGVMYRYFTEIMLEVGAAEGWPIDELPLGPTGRVPDPDYEAMSAGEVDEAGYLATVLQRLVDRGIAYDPRRDIDWSQQWRESTWEVIEAVHAAGHLQALVTNDASKWLGPRWWRTWEPVRWFDAVVDVATLPARKPAPEPYLAAAERLGVAPADCLFVDDMVVNCTGAEAVGMASHHVDIRDAGGSVARLADRLGLHVPTTR